MGQEGNLIPKGGIPGDVRPSRIAQHQPCPRGSFCLCSPWVRLTTCQIVGYSCCWTQVGHVISSQAVVLDTGHWESISYLSRPRPPCGLRNLCNGDLNQLWWKIPNSSDECVFVYMWERVHRATLSHRKYGSKHQATSRHRRYGPKVFSPQVPRLSLSLHGHEIDAFHPLSSNGPFLHNHSLMKTPKFCLEGSSASGTRVFFYNFIGTNYIL